MTSHRITWIAIAIATIIGSLTNLAFWTSFSLIAQEGGMTISEVLGLNSIEGRAAVREGIAFSLWPQFDVQYCYWAYLPAILAAIMLVFGKRNLDGPNPALAISILPFIGGLGGFPLLVQASLRAIASLGLGSPIIAARGLGEATTLPILGLYLSVALLVFDLWLRHTRQQLLDPDSSE